MSRLSQRVKNKTVMIHRRQDVGTRKQQPGVEGA